MPGGLSGGEGWEEPLELTDALCHFESVVCLFKTEQTYKAVTFTNVQIKEYLEYLFNIYF